jgi:hypothetical protein
MRRRQQQQQHQQHQQPQEHQGVIPSDSSKTDPESLSVAISTNITIPREIMMSDKSVKSTPMGVSTTFEVQSGAAQERNKPFSLWPRSYNQRRQVVLGGCVFFLFVWIVKGETNQ